MFRNLFVAVLELGAIVAVLAWSASSSNAAPFSLDPSFGTGGVVATPLVAFGPSTFVPAGNGDVIAVRPDGKILVLGAQQDPNPPFPVVMRFNPDGSLDPSFGVGGSVTTDTGASTFRGVIARQPDGKLLLGGSSETPGVASLETLYRFDSEGAIDVTFGQRGTATTLDPTGNGSIPGALIVQRDGKIVTAGSSGFKAFWHFLVVRFGADGQLDSTFGNGGAVQPQVLQPGAPVGFLRDDAMQVVQQPDGKLLVAGTAGGYVVVARLNADGSMDTTFGAGGFSLVDMRGPVSGASVTGLLLQPDGRIIVGGSAQYPVAPMLIRLTALGALDPTFGSAGVVIKGIAGTNAARIAKLVLQPDGRIVAANTGYTQFPQLTPSMALLTRYDVNGVLDPTFGNAGIVAIPALTTAISVAEQPDGNWIVAGTSTSSASPGSQVLTLARILGGSMPAIEFHHAGLDHYFLTANPDEVHDLDFGIHAGWTRSGLSFQVFGSMGAASIDASPACRFYIPPQHGDSHFISGSPAECATVLQKTQTDPNYSGYLYESPHVFYVPMPDESTRACPSGTAPVYRVWNQRVDSNHRYTSDRAARDALIASGWLAEGDGPNAVAMCSPTQ